MSEYTPFKMKGITPLKQVKKSQEQLEDEKGVTTNIKMPKVMKDGSKNRTHSAKPYQYKINGKPVTKAQYIKYQNKPGGDEPGKTTNDPDVYGRKATNYGRGPKTKQ